MADIGCSIHKHQCWLYYSIYMTLTVSSHIIYSMASGIPKIEKFSFQDNVVEGQIVSVTCLAVSDVQQPLAFHWDKDGKPIDSKSVRVESGEQYSLLILNGVSLHSEGNYTCTVSNSAGSSKHMARLEVKVPPKWIKTPEDVTLAIGESFQAECAAAGSPKPQILWRKYTGNEMKLISKQESKQDEVLQIKSLSSEDAGLYQCSAVNNVPPNITANFTLKIRVRFIFLPLKIMNFNMFLKLAIVLTTSSVKGVKIEPFSFVRTYKEGEKAQVACFATSQSEDVAFEWLRDGRPLPLSENVRLQNTNEFSIIIIDPVDVLSSGNYTCKAADSHSTADYSAQLQVEAPPKWKEETKNVTTSLGAKIVIHCISEGSPRPQVKLRKLSEVRTPEMTSENGTFTLTSLTAEDAGLYSCEADNGVGNAIFKNFSIVVEGRICRL